MVFNNTKVIQARLHFRKAPSSDAHDGMQQGALIEVFCLEPCLPNDYQLNFSQKGMVQWYCLVGNLKKWKSGKLFRNITTTDGEHITLACERKGQHGTSHIIEFTWDGNYTWAEVLDADGFDAFKETGDIFNQEVAERFRKYILTPGGIDDGMSYWL